ncbi:MAG: SDR family NAD(P)-dependent oxidoreductase [Chitinophagaceae bacterium]|nr:SDR family NAD(P)-dependent oxidoreductase [Chitinophagaceae bacterium]
MSNTIFITGGTSGFGHAIARIFAKNKYRIIITGRRTERLREVADELRNEFNAEVLSLNFDVCDKEAVTNAVTSMPDGWKNEISILVNNAGLAAGLDLIQDGNTDDWDQMIDTNVKGLLYVTKAIVPFLIAKQQGHIFNMGSLAAKHVYEKGNVYCASKFAVDALSQSMRIDLLKHRIKVTTIHPGAVETEFSNVRFKGDNERAKAVYNGYQPLIAEDIANVVFYCATLPPHVCINELQISPTAQASPFYLDRKQ